MKKEEPKKDKKTRKTHKKTDAASLKSHKENEDALFTENSELNPDEQLKPVSPVEESVNSDLNDTELIPETPVSNENAVEQNLQEITENISEDVNPETAEIEIPQNIGYSEQPVEKLMEYTEEENIQPAEETQTPGVVQKDEEVQPAEETQPAEVVQKDEIAQPVEETQPAEIVRQEEDESHETEKPELVFPKSNYQISLINENLLRIVVETDKPVGVDCFVKNRKPDEGDSTQTQSNRILVHPKEIGKLQEVEIIVSIDKSEGVKIVETEKKSDEESLQESTPASEDSKEKKPKKFLIDPSVADILQKPVPAEIQEKYKPMTREEYFEDKLKPSKNKFAINRALVEKHLKIGIVASIILLIFSMIVYSGITSDNESGDEQRPQRLIVIQDIPEMKVDIPLEEKKDEAGEDKTDVTPKINIRRNPIRTPRIEITKKDTTAKTDSTDIAKNNEELDKLRRGDTTGTGTSVSGINSTDTINANAVSLPFGNYGWVLIDSLDYGGRKFKFSSDTSQVIKDPSEVGKVSDFKMFVIQDIKGTEFSCGKNLRDFPVLVTEYKAYKCEPRDELLSNQIEYMYRIINKDNTYAITIKVEYKKEYKPEYYPKVDTLVSQIRLPQFLKTEN